MAGDANSLRPGYSSTRLSLALCIGGLCMLAVFFEAPDNGTKVEESLKQNNMQQLPESVEDFMMVAVKTGTKISPWHTFKEARKKARAIANPADPEFKKLEKKCGNVRASAFLACGKSFCKAKFACGTPCKHPSETEVVPLASGYGPQFYNMHEGSEKAAMKKKRALEQAKKLAAQKLQREKAVKAAEKVRTEKAVKQKQKQDAARIKARESALEQAKKAHHKAQMKKEKASKHAVALKASKKVVRAMVKTKKFVKKKALVTPAEKAASAATQGMVRQHVHELSTKAATQAKQLAKSRLHRQHQAKVLAKKKALLAHAAKAHKGASTAAQKAAQKHANELKHKVATQENKLSAARKQRKKHAKALVKKTKALKKVLKKQAKVGIAVKHHLKHAKELSGKVQSRAKKVSAARKHSKKQLEALAKKKKVLAAAQKEAQKCQQFWTKQNGRCVQTCPLKTQMRHASGRCKCGLGGSNQLCYVGSTCKNNACEDKHPKKTVAKKKKLQAHVKESSHKVSAAGRDVVAARKQSKAQASALAKKKASLAHTAKMARRTAKASNQKRVHELTAKVAKKAKQLSIVRQRSRQQAKVLAKKKALAAAAAATASGKKSAQVRELSQKVSIQAKQLAAARQRSKAQAKALAAAVAAPKKALAENKKITHRAAVKAVEDVKAQTGIFGTAMKAAQAAASARLKAKTHKDWAGDTIRPSKQDLQVHALKAASAATKAAIQQGIKTLARKEAAKAYKFAIRQKHTKAYARMMSKKVAMAARKKGVSAGLRIVHRAVNRAVAKVMAVTAKNAKSAMERHHKLGPAAAEERTMKSNSLLKCNKRGQQVYMKCEDRRLARIKIKAKESAFKVLTDKKNPKLRQNATFIHEHEHVAAHAHAALKIRTAKDNAAKQSYASSAAARAASKMVAHKIIQKRKMINKKLGPKTAKIVRALQRRPNLLKKGKKAMSHRDHKKFVRRAKRGLRLARQVHNGAYASSFMSKASTQAAIKSAYAYSKKAMRPTLLMQQAPAAQTVQANKTLDAMKSKVVAAKALLKREDSAVKTQRLRIKYEKTKAQLADKDLQAGEKYTQTHRGYLHRKTCADEMRYAFDLCFGRMRWKNEVAHKKNEAKDAKRLAAAKIKDAAAASALKKDEKTEMQAAAAGITVTAIAKPKVATEAASKAAPKTTPKAVQLSLVQSDVELKHNPTQKERMCYRAKMGAYSQCRATVNAAYMECAHWYGKIKPSKKGTKTKGM